MSHIAGSRDSDTSILTILFLGQVIAAAEAQALALWNPGNVPKPSPTAWVSGLSRCSSACRHFQPRWKIRDVEVVYGMH